MRSEYFKMLLTSTDFLEGQLNAEMMEAGSRLKSQIQHLPCQLAEPDIVATALRWMYTDRIDMELPLHHLLKVTNMPVSKAGQQF